jgi:hypothetical protein
MTSSAVCVTCARREHGAVGVGWDPTLSGLTRHLASGASVDPAEGAAWSASEEGRLFMTLSSQAWCDASIVAGTDSADARAAAASTTAAYTGIDTEISTTTS